VLSAPLTDTRLPTTACRILPASDAVGVGASSSVVTLRYMDDPRLEADLNAPAAPGGSLKGDSSIGLTGAESENGFLILEGVGGSGDAPSTVDRYGGGAVAVENGRGIGSAATATTGGTDERGGLGGVTCIIASR